MIFPPDKPVWLSNLQPYYRLNDMRSHDLEASGMEDKDAGKGGLKDTGVDKINAKADEDVDSPSPPSQPTFNDLILSSISGPLPPASQQSLLTTLKSSGPHLLPSSPLNPSNFKDLVESNPSIAHGVMVQLLKSNSGNEYLTTLVNMDMSLPSMEVVNRLTLTVELPKEFVHLYIANCITSCTSITDRYLQSRLVRLVCVFLQSLLRNRIIKAEDLYIEVGAFCVEFSRIREAAGLFKLIKKREGTS